MSVAGYRDRLKSDIIRLSREILAREGLDGLQARKIAVASDCSVGTIYNLFGNLDMVVIAANSETLTELQEALVNSHPHTGDLAERLNALAMTYLRFAMERTSEWRAIFEHRLSAKATVPDWYRNDQAELFGIVEALLEQAIPSVDQRREIARALFSAVHGVISLALDQKLGEFDEEATKRQVTFVVQAAARKLQDDRAP